MAGNNQYIKVTDNFTIPPDAELAKMPVDFKIKVNLYWVASIIRGVAARNPKHPILPNQVIVDVGIQITFCEPEANLAASFICNTIKYWHEIHKRDQLFFVANADKLFVSDHIKPKTLPTIFEEKLITPEEVTKVWNYLNTMIRQCIRWMNGLLKGNLEIVLCELDGEGKKNPNAVTMTRDRLLQMAKLHEVTDI